MLDINPARPVGTFRELVHNILNPEPQPFATVLHDTGRALRGSKLATGRALRGSTTQDSSRALLRPPAQAVPVNPWHAIRTYPNREIEVAAALSDPSTFNLPTYCPRYPATFVRNHRTHHALIPYLSTYFFARWDAHDPYLWHALRAIPGLHSFVGNPIAPDPIPDAHLRALQEHIGPDGEFIAAQLSNAPLRPHPHTPNSTVLINRGPFAARIALTTSVSPDNLFVTLRINSLLGRDHDIKVPSEWCDRIESSGPPSTTTARSGPAHIPQPNQGDVGRSKQRRSRKRRAKR